MTGWPPEGPEPFRYDPASGLAQGGPWELPHPPTRLESNAIIAGVHPDLVRDDLEREVLRRRALAAARTDARTGLSPTPPIRPGTHLVDNR